MKLQQIDKAVYRKRSTQLMIMTVVILLATSLSVSNILIALFGSEVNGENFWLNAAGVIAGLFVISLVYKVILAKPYMAEVNYVRNLKKEMNRIYRNSKMLQAKTEEGNKQALIISYYNFQLCKQIYQLDNNTLTMDELNEKIRALDQRLEEMGLEITADDYTPELLDELKSVT